MVFWLNLSLFATLFLHRMKHLSMQILVKIWIQRHLLNRNWRQYLLHGSRWKSSRNRFQRRVEFTPILRAISFRNLCEALLGEGAGLNQHVSFLCTFRAVPSSWVFFCLAAIVVFDKRQAPLCFWTQHLLREIMGSDNKVEDVAQSSSSKTSDNDQ